MAQSEQVSRSTHGPLAAAEPEPDALRAVSPVPIGERDVRAKRPPLLSFLLRWDTGRRLSRVITLLALDLVGVFLAIYTALILKAVIRGRVVDTTLAYHQTRSFVAFAYLITVLLFARSGLYSDRGERPGFTRILASLFQVALVALIFAVVQGDHFSSYYVFYGSFFFALIYISAFHLLYEKGSGLLLRLAGYRRRAVLVGSGAHIEAVAHALGRGSAPALDVIGFISLEPRPDNGLRSLGRLEEIGEVIDAHRIDEVIIADPDFPDRQGVELDRQRASAWRARAHRAVDDGYPGAPRGVRAGTDGAAVRAAPAGVRGLDFVLKRLFDIVVATLLLTVLARCCSRSRSP